MLVAGKIAERAAELEQLLGQFDRMLQRAQSRQHGRTEKSVARQALLDRYTSFLGTMRFVRRTCTNLCGNSASGRSALEEFMLVNSSQVIGAVRRQLSRPIHDLDEGLRELTTSGRNHQMHIRRDIERVQEALLLGLQRS